LYSAVHAKELTQRAAIGYNGAWNVQLT